VVIVDSTGWVEGEAATAFKLQEIAALHPALVLAIERGDELGHILTRLTCPVLRIRSSEHVRTRTARGAAGATRTCVHCVLREGTKTGF